MTRGRRRNYIFFFLQHCACNIVSCFFSVSLTFSQSQTGNGVFVVKLVFYHVAYFRYYGKYYDQLVALKHDWDPDNVFNHCQSVGSTDANCCPQQV